MIDLKQTVINTGKVIWQKVEQCVQGGFTLIDAVLAAGSTVPAGTPVAFDESTRTAKVCKLGIAQAVAANNATTYKVLKGHNLVVGMSVKSGASDSKAITAIDTADANFDVITLDATLAVAVAVGDSIYVDDDGFNKANGLLLSDVDLNASSSSSVSVVIKGTVYARRITPMNDAVRAKIPHVIFSQSY